MVKVIPLSCPHTMYTIIIAPPKCLKVIIHYDKIDQLEPMNIKPFAVKKPFKSNYNVLLLFSINSYN